MLKRPPTMPTNPPPSQRTAMPLRLGWLAAWLVVVGSAGAAELPAPQATTAPSDGVRLSTTPSGVRFGTWGSAIVKPAPTLLVLAGSIQSTLGSGNGGYYRQSGTFLERRGYLCVSLDLPCHGQAQQAGETAGLQGWRERIEAGQPLIEPFHARVRAVLDHLIESGQTDLKRIAACGVSRGGFAALHLAAREPRIAAVAVFAPVTDLAALGEFAGAEPLSPASPLSLFELADRLAGRPVWIVIGDQDQRVGTDRAVAFARQVAHRAQQRQLTGALELHVLPEPGGHTTPRGSFEKAAHWIDHQLHPQAAP